MSYYTGAHGVCHQFRDSGKCTYGERCKFSHDLLATQLRSTTLTRAPYRASTRTDHIKAFFDTYHDFQYDSRRDAVSEWKRLCQMEGYDPEDHDEFFVRDSRRNLRTAMVRQFNAKYGEDAYSVEAWQTLCRTVDIEVPDTLDECRKAIQATHVNLVDLTENDEGDVVEIYPTEVSLSAYTKSTDKYFPREHAEAGGLLVMLLRHINQPRPEWMVRGEGGPKGGRRGRRHK